MFPNPWVTSIPQSVTTKPMINNYENNTQPYPFYTTPNAMPNMNSINQQNALTMNSASMTQSIQPNAIDPAMVQKWQEWKRWELWQQQFQQWQQQTGQIATAPTQPAPPPMPPPMPASHSLQPAQPAMPFQNQQYSYNQTALPPLPQDNQPQQFNQKIEIGMKRGLEPEYQNNEKKIKVEIANNKKEIELNDETEVLFEEQFKSWEKQFLTWKEQNKNHPDKVQYLEYEKKWLNWRDHLKQKCETLKKKRELKIAEKKKESIQIEESTQQKTVYNPIIGNIATPSTEPTLHQAQNNSSMKPTIENQIPGLDLVGNNENITKEFLNVSKIIPQNQNGPIQTPDDKPFNFPKNVTNPTTIQSHSVTNIPFNNMNQPPTSMYQNSPNWSNNKYNNHMPYYNQKPLDVDNASISKFNHQTDIHSQQQPYSRDSSNTNHNNSQNTSINYRKLLERPYNKPTNETGTMFNKPPNDQQTDINSRQQSYGSDSSNTNYNNSQNASNMNYRRPLEGPYNKPQNDQQTDINSRQQSYGGDSSNTNYNNSQNISNMNYRRPLEGPYNKSANETGTIYNKPPNDQSYNRSFNTSNSNFCGSYKPDENTSNFNNFNQPSENSNTYQHTKPSLNTGPSKPSLNTGPSKPPSLLSLNVVKPILLDKQGNYSENMNIAPNRYERNWNVTDEEDDPENEYMEAHKKFSSEPFNNQNDEFSNNHHRNVYNDNNYSREQQGLRNFDNNYSRPLTNFNQSRGPQLMKNTDNEYHRPNSKFSIKKQEYRNNNQNYPRDMQTNKEDDYDYYKPQNNMRGMNQGFSRGAPSFSNDINDEYSNEPTIDKNKGNYRPPSKGSYESSRGNFGNNNKTNMEWDNDYSKNEGSQHSETIIPPLVTKQPYLEAPPIDPVKIFDYRHLSTLKVIPGLSKETVIPIRVYDYKHGGKRLLPWQDRGFSRRNSNQPKDLNENEDFSRRNTKDLNEKEGSNQDNAENLDKNKESFVKKPTFILNDFSTDVKDTNVSNNKFDEIKKEEQFTTIDSTIFFDNKEKEENSQLDIEMNICTPSPPKMSNIKEIKKINDRQLLSIETLLCPPGRYNRPSKIVIILRGLPGSGKSYIAKLIKEKEVAMGGQAPRILSLDDYFMAEVTKTEIDPETNKKVEKKVLEYEHDSANESLYRTSFIKAFKKKILENYFSFYIIDAINNKVSYYKDIIEISKSNGFNVYIIELESNIDLCIKHNIHNRTAHDINNIMKSWVKTPEDQILLEIRSLLHSPSKSEADMEDVSDVEMELDKDEEAVDDDSKSEENTNLEFEEEDVMKLLSCKWVDTIPQEEKMKRLDGLYKKKTESTIKEWLQMPDDDSTINEQQVIVQDGKKRVRWADMEECREQEKMRAIGFVVGQTDWDRMLGRDQGESKLTQTKYI